LNVSHLLEQGAKTAAPSFRQTTIVVIKDEMPTLSQGWHFYYERKKVGVISDAPMPGYIQIAANDLPDCRKLCCHASAAGNHHPFTSNGTLSTRNYFLAG